MSGISSPFGQNEWLVEEMYRKFREDPSSVDPSWHEFLADYKPDASQGDGAAKPAPAAAPRRPQLHPLLPQLLLPRGAGRQARPAAAAPPSRRQARTGGGARSGRR